jgi:hypothetical protein
MKKGRFHRSVVGTVCLAMCLLLIIGSMGSAAAETFHSRTSRMNPDRIFMFRDIPGVTQLIPHFPFEMILKDSYLMDSGEIQDHLLLFHIFDEGDTVKVGIFYQVFTSVNDAEEKIMEVLLMDSGAYGMGEKGEIGDTSWIRSSSIWFIRSNVVVGITTEYFKNQDKQKIIDYVKIIDSILCEIPKVDDSSQIQAPIIISTEIVPTLQQYSEHLFSIKVTAKDPNGKKLYYSSLGGKPWAIPYSTDGILRLLKPNISRYTIGLIWVMNEDRIVSSLEKDFYSSSAIDSNEISTEAPQVFTLSQNAPNPFNPSTVISFSVVSAAPSRLAVYDALGREVAVLVDGFMQAGNHEVRWNGRDSNGNPVSSGVYLYRLEAGGKAETKKMMLVR